MDQLYPIPGPTTSSCASQDFDFLNYWVDQSVEKEIQRGKQLRELKQRPTLRKKKYDVINIGHTNIYSEKKHKRRSRSPHKSRRNTRRNSPKRKKSPVRRFTEKDSKSARAQRCPMRIAELSVPSKRQCIDTWRNKYHVLPEIMIERLREHVLDLRPVVKIPDAIECFKIHKNVERKQKKENKQRKLKIAVKECDCPRKIKVKPRYVQQCRYFCAIFGHKIAKELNKPVQVTLNSELQNISNIVFDEIEKIINVKGVGNTNVKNRKVQAEVAGKITIWMSNILEESAYKILEDQLKDLEEEIGPVLDVIDDLVDNAVDICEPEPEVIEVSSSSDISPKEYESEDEARAEEIGEVESQSVISSVDAECLPKSQSTIAVVENFDDYIKNELDKIIDAFDQENMSFDVDNIAVEDDTFTDTEDQPKLAFENQTDKEQNEFVDANDTLEVEVPLDIKKLETQAKLDLLQDSSQADQGTLITDHERDSVTDIVSENESNKIADQGTLITDHERDSVTDIVSEDESNKKVKFSDINMVTIEESKEPGAKVTPEHYNTDIFFTPNDHILSEADESWPEDISLPLIRPSESVSKSVTSLGRIMEEDERTSTMLDITTKDKASAQNDILENERDQDDIVDSMNDTKAAQIGAVDNTTDLLRQKRLELFELADEAENDSIGSLAKKEPAQIQPSSDETKDGIVKSVTENGSPQIKQPSDKVDYGMIDSEPKQKDQFELATESAKDEIVVSKQIKSPPPGFSYEQKETESSNQYIIDENGTIYTDYGTHSPSTDSTFPGDIPIKSAEYEHKLSQITENSVDNLEDRHIEEVLKEYAKREVEKLLGQASLTREGKIETAEIGTNTSYTLILRDEKSTSVTSQSLGDITKYLQIKKPDLFSSLRIKSNDYKVDKKFAPTWVSRNYEEPCYTTPKPERKVDTKEEGKVTCDKNIRLWCKDLENGFDNLELWNGWIEKTVQCVKITEMKKARICLDKSREQFVRDWLHLKKNVDADVQTWAILSKCTQEKMKAFRKIYQNFETPTSGPKQSNSCSCHR